MFLVRARRMFHGSVRFDFVRVQSSSGDIWIARVLALFQVDAPPHPMVPTPGWIILAMVQWLERTESVIPDVPTFRYLPEPDVVDPATFLGVMKLVPFPCQAEDDEPRLVAPPQGKTNMFNGDLSCAV